MSTVPKPLPQTRSDPTADPVSLFVARHQAGVWRFLRLLGCRGQAADELAQEALLVALRRGVDSEAEVAAAAFLRQTAKFLWLRQQRADRRRAERHAAAAELLWTRDLAADDGAGWLEALDRCLQELPSRSRLALERTYRDGIGRSELAAELGIGEHGARTLLQRLRAALRDCIERRRQP